MDNDKETLLNTKLKQWYKDFNTLIQNVLNVFNDFFGEENVDLQDIIKFNTFKTHISTLKLSNLYNINNEKVSNKIKEFKDCTLTELPLEAIQQLSNNLPTKFYSNSLLANVDPFILVHFPQVKVTNENSTSTIINHLWAKVFINYNGTLSGTFELNRSEYSVDHFLNNYMHSHVRDIPTYDFTQFQYPCLGSGPIKATCLSLNVLYDLDLWNLFCLELKKYVETESIVGVPYHYLEELGNYKNKIKDSYITYSNRAFNTYPTYELRKFADHIIHNNILRFNYVNGSYTIGMPFYEFIIRISNEFIDHYKEIFKDNKALLSPNSLYNCGILKECYKRGHSLYEITNTYDYGTLSRYNNRLICKFKGEYVKLNISDTISSDSNSVCTIVNPVLALAILSVILKVLNYQYGRTETNSTEQNKTEIWFL